MSPTTRSSAAATSPTAPTSRRSSTPPARPAAPRAACSRTATSSSCAATRRVALNDVLTVPGSSTLLFITTAHIFARFISILDIHAGVKTGHQPDTKQLLPALGSFKPTFLLAVPRVFEKVYNSSEQKAEAGGKGKIFRAAAHTAVEHSTPAAGRQEDPAADEAQVHAVRPARLQQAAHRHGRPRRSTPSRARRRSARASATSSTASASRSSRATASPRRPLPRPSTSPRSRRSAPSARRCPGVGVRLGGGRRDPGARHQRLQGVLAQPRGHGRDVRRRLVQDRRHRLVRRRGLPHRSPVARRRSSSRPAARTSPPPRSRTRSAPTRSSARSSSSATRSRSSRR